MPLPLIPIAIAALAGAAIIVKRRRDAQSSEQGQMTPARQVVYEQAMQSDDPIAVAQAAQAFQAQGLPAQAAALQAKAKIAAVPKNLQDARLEVLKAALNSKDKAQVKTIARSFHGEGYAESGMILDRYAESLPETGAPETEGSN